MTEPSRAVFLSYASQDAEAAQRICEALRAAGIEVWFDKSQLRGGDAWDQSIRRQIKNCALFIPVISENTHNRAEGYFRLEWKLAVDRSHLIMANKAFLLPVVIDGTGDDDENVPDKFRDVQWTRLPGGETPVAFVDHVQRLLSGESSLPVPSGVSSTRSPGPTRRRIGVLAGVPAAIVAAGITYVAVKHFTESKAPVKTDLSIAVLPLANESGDPDQQYFSDGISEDLITALSQYQNLKVIGRASSFQFRNSKEDSRSIGAKLGVAHLVEGSIRRSGDMIRVSAELIDTTDGRTQWSERFDRPHKELFSLQDEITHALTAALHEELLPGEHAAAQDRRPPSGNLEAYYAILQGNFYFARVTEANLRKAIESYTQATQLDPRYALAWTGLSCTWTGLGEQWLEGTAAKEAYAKAREANDRALALAADLADAHQCRGYLLENADLDWRGAEAEYRRALELEPDNLASKFHLAELMAVTGQLDQAIDLARQALVSSPLAANWYYWLANYLSGANRLDEAERAIRRAIELQPGAESYHVQLAIIEIQRGHAAAALAAAQQEPPGLYQDIGLALAQQIGSDRSAADAALKALIDKDTNNSPYQIAQVYALRSDPAKTFEWLDRAWSSRDPGISYLLYDPFILRFKDDSRFAAFCRKVGLPVPGEKPAGSST